MSGNPTDQDLAEAFARMQAMSDELAQRLDRCLLSATKLREENMRLATENELLRLRIDRLQRELEGTRRIVLQ